MTEAMENPRQIDMELVDAYLARRALDYLVGFNLSPVLWRKLPGAKSAGPGPVGRAPPDRRPRDGDRGLPRPRVLDASRRILATPARRHLRGAPRQPRRQASSTSSTSPTRPPPPAAVAAIEARDLTVTAVESKPATRNPSPPFMTSTLQQEASRKFGMGARQTMSAAQRLYEAGHITYMRTDGIDMAPEAVMAARDVIQRPLRRRLRARPARDVQEQGQERPGSPRVHPADRHGRARPSSSPRSSPTSASSTT